MNETKNRNQNEKTRRKWKPKMIGGILSGFLVLLVIIFTFLKTPLEITAMLTTIATNLQYYFLAVHIAMLVVLILGFVLPKYRNYIFFGFALYLSLSATVISAIYVIIPNIIIFGLIFSLLIIAFAQKKLDFSFKRLKAFDIIFGVIGLFIGFWYLHWVADPIWLNALLYSPLGGVNCPTLVVLSGLICFSTKPRFNALELSLGVLTMYFGFFGIFRLQAYVDIALVLCGGYLIIRNLLRFIKRNKSPELEEVDTKPLVS